MIRITAKQNLQVLKLLINKKGNTAEA